MINNCTVCKRKLEGYFKFIDICSVECFYMRKFQIFNERDKNEWRDADLKRVLELYNEFETKIEESSDV